MVLCSDHETYYIQVDRRGLMSSLEHRSEEALAHLGLGQLTARRRPRILVGGLGMGFTLRATLDCLGRGCDAEVVVAELIPAVVRWNQGPLGSLAGRPLEDQRVRVADGDVAAIVAAETTAFDAILLDVDNGPAAFSTADNAHLYSPRGLTRMARGLTAGGVLAVWSTHHEPRFAERMRRAGFTTSVHRVRASTEPSARRHVIFVGRLRDAESAPRTLSPRC